MNAVTNIFGKELKEMILKRKGKVVLRPDSGYPPEVSLNILKSLWKSYGGKTNSSGYKVLDPHIGVIYGDGINRVSIERILFNVTTLGGFAPSNIIFGMGGALLQKVDRDTLKFAIKCSWAKIGDKEIDVYKDPITDPGKASKRGRLKLIDFDNGIKTTAEAHPYTDIMVTVFENGKLFNELTFDQIRKNAEVTK
jgi:nicotinamide phosphoribosyltransferase